MTAYFERYLHGDSSDWNFSYCFGDSLRGHPTMDSVEVRLPPVGVEEPESHGWSRDQYRAVVVRNALFVPAESFDHSSGVFLYNVTGIRVMRLHAGANDVRHLTPGAYFVCQLPADNQRLPAVAKILLVF